MLRDSLKDIVKHTHSLGFIEAVKISNEEGVTKIDAIASDRSVVMYAKLKEDIVGLEDTMIGFSRMGVLSGMLNFPPFMSDSAKVELGTQPKGDGEVPCEVKFTSTAGHGAVYRFMSKEAVEESIKVPSFKGVNWDVSFEPTKANLKDLSYFSGVLGSYEPVFTVLASSGNIEFQIGGGTADKSVVPIAKGVSGKLKHQMQWPLTQVLAILKLSDNSKCEMFFSDGGAAKIVIDSGLGVYEYIIPARLK